MRLRVCWSPSLVRGGAGSKGVSTDHSRSMRWPPGSGGIASRTLRPAGQSAPASLSSVIEWGPMAA